MVLTSLYRARTRFAEAIWREGRHYSQTPREKEESRGMKEEGPGGGNQIEDLVYRPAARATMGPGLGDGVLPVSVAPLLREGQANGVGG